VAPSQPILSDNDSTLHSNFLEDITSDNSNTASFGEGQNFNDDWLNLPLRFLGSTVSFGQQPAASLGSHGHGFQNSILQDLFLSSLCMTQPPPPLPPSVQSANVLATAALLQYGSLPRPNNSSHMSMFAEGNIGFSVPPSIGHLQRRSISDFQQSDQRMSQLHVPSELTMPSQR
jgi:hypothetical protein